jgi:hypothetical protein
MRGCALSQRAAADRWLNRLQYLNLGGADTAKLELRYDASAQP